MSKHDNIFQPPRVPKAATRWVSIICIALIAAVLAIVHVSGTIITSFLTAKFAGPSPLGRAFQSHGPVFKPTFKPASDIHNSTLGFQKIFVISSPERATQRDVMTVAASVTGLSFEIVEGVQRKAGDFDIWRSKMNAIRRILEEGLGSALILGT